MQYPDNIFIAQAKAEEKQDIPPFRAAPDF
jgi:hypothetical protein